MAAAASLMWVPRVHGEEDNVKNVYYGSYSKYLFSGTILIYSH